MLFQLYSLQASTVRPGWITAFFGDLDRFRVLAFPQLRLVIVSFKLGIDHRGVGTLVNLPLLRFLRELEAEPGMPPPCSWTRTAAPAGCRSSLLTIIHIGKSTMNPATNRFSGLSYSCRGGATCWMAPSFMTTIRVPIVIASSKRDAAQHGSPLALDLPLVSSHVNSMPNEQTEAKIGFCSQLLAFLRLLRFLVAIRKLRYTGAFCYFREERSRCIPGMRRSPCR